MELCISPERRLALTGEGDLVNVTPRRCFPWTEPEGHVSLRDDDDNEAAFIEDPAALNQASRDALRQALRDTDFVLNVEQVHAVTRGFELRRWEVLTRQGPRRFQTRLDDWPRPLPDGGAHVRDLFGDIYRIPPLDTLDEKSRRLLWPLMDLA